MKLIDKLNELKSLNTADDSAEGGLMAYKQVEKYGE